jgi:hypothetical protein
MNGCPSAAVLVELEEALDWSAAETLAHVAACGRCTTALDDLELLRAAAPALEPDPGFAAQVMSALPGTREVGSPGASSGRAPVAGLFALASIAAWLTLSFSSEALAGPSFSAGSMTVGALVAGAMVAVRSRVAERKQGTVAAE